MNGWNEKNEKCEDGCLRWNILFCLQNFRSHLTACDHVHILFGAYSEPFRKAYINYTRFLSIYLKLINSLGSKYANIQLILVHLECRAICSWVTI